MLDLQFKKIQHVVIKILHRGSQGFKTIGRDKTNNNIIEKYIIKRNYREETIQFTLTIQLNILI
jgi:hypothetical protein